ncbi:MAG: GNAT family N-acetyltransferase [Bdellovibrio sp.]
MRLTNCIEDKLVSVSLNAKLEKFRADDLANLCYSKAMQVEFFHAKISDAKEIQRLYCQLVSDPNISVTDNAVDAISQDDFNCLIVGKLGNKVIATAFLVICRDVMYADQPFAVVENIVVDSPYQSNKVGTKLMDYLKVLCKSKKCTKIMLMSSSKRIEAHKFFEKCGYRSDLKKGFVNYVNR